jgi:hypothetical protein
MKKGPESVRQHLFDSPVLRSLRKQFHAQEQLLNSLKKQLPAELGQHCTAINRQGQTLVISVDAAVWATKLRFLTRQLTRATGASQVRIRVSTPQSETQRPAKTAVPGPRRSSVAVATLDHAARHQPDEQLRQALQRLADAIKREPSQAGRKR